MPGPYRARAMYPLADWYAPVWYWYVPDSRGARVLRVGCLVLERLYPWRDPPRTPARPFLLLRPLAVRVEVLPRPLLLLALAVAADPEPVEEVDEQHGQPTSDRHG